MRRVLMICPYFAPTANVGAKRSIRFVRHLRDYDWEPLVLTIDGSAGDGTDNSLLDLLPKDLTIRRTYAGLLWPLMQKLEETKARARGREGSAKPISGSSRKIFEDFSRKTLQWTPIDQMIPFVAGAIIEATRFAKEQRADAIYASSWPFSGLFVATITAQRLGLPLLLDLRDPWALDSLIFPYKPKPIQLIESQLESYCFKHASRVLFNTRAATQMYQAYYPSLQEKFFTLHNGFDRQIFLPSDHKPPTDHFVLMHFGSMMLKRTIHHLVEVLKQFPQLKVIEYGTFRPEDLTLAESLGVRSQLEERKQVPFIQSMQILQQANALLLVQPEETRTQIPAKTYDYLCAGRPIIALTQNPEIADILRETNAGIAVANDDGAALCRALETVMNGKLGTPNQSQIDAFESHKQTQTLANHLNAMMG